MKRFVQQLSVRHQSVTVLLLAHLLALLVLAASPRLHHWLHPHEDDDDGDCAVVLFLHAGSGTAPEPTCILAFVRLAGADFDHSATVRAFVPTVFAGSRIFEHAPPQAG